MREIKVITTPNYSYSCWCWRFFMSGRRRKMMTSGGLGSASFVAS